MTLAQLKQQRGIILDTNLMLLYCVGQSDPYMISKFIERLSRYNVDDYNLLVQFVGLFKQVATTPNVLTETINLIDKKSGRFDKVLTRMASYVVGLNELNVPSSYIVSQYPRQFLTFGLTDLVLYDLAQQSYLVLTDDAAIWSFMAGNNGSTLNFNQLRTLLIQKEPPSRR